MEDAHCFPGGIGGRLYIHSDTSQPTPTKHMHGVKNTINKTYKMTSRDMRRTKLIMFLNLCLLV